MKTLLAVIAIIGFVLALICYSCCYAGGKADEAMERYEASKKEGNK